MHRDGVGGGGFLVAFAGLEDFGGEAGCGFGGIGRGGGYIRWSFRHDSFGAGGG